MQFEEKQSGLLSVRYATAEDLKVSQQQALIARLETKRGAVVIIFDVADEVRSVVMEVPTFWLGVTARPELRIAGMGIVTRSYAVRVAARGFALANVARSIATSVQTFDTVQAANEWAATVLAAR